MSITNIIIAWSRSVSVVIACLIFINVMFLEMAAASPWGRDRHQIFVSSRADYFRTAIPDFSDPVINNRFERIESNSYVEYGLTSKFTVGAKALYGTSWLTSTSGVEAASGISEIEGFIQREVFRSQSHVGALKLSVARPADLSSGVRSGLQSDGYDLEAQFGYGRTLNSEPLKIFVTSEAGYRRRFGDAADQIRLNAAIGFEPISRVLILVETFSTLSVKNETGGGTDYDVVKIQPSIAWRASRRFALQAGVTEEIAGRNIALGRTLFIGLWTEF